MAQINAMISKTRRWEILCMRSLKAHSSCALMVFSVLSSGIHVQTDSAKNLS